MKSPLLLIALPLLLLSCSDETSQDLSYAHTQADAIPQKGEPFPYATIDLTPDAEKLVTAVLSDVLSNKSLAFTLEFYGPTPLTTIAFGTFGSKYALPNTYQPRIAGYGFIHLGPQYEHPKGAPALLEMDIRRLAITGDRATIELVITCAGGKPTIGGCCVRYEANRKDSAWTVRMMELRD